MAFKQAVINFVVNTSAAKQQLQTFKSNFQSATKQMGDTFIGKFGAIGAAFGGYQAIKDVFKETEKLTNFANSFSIPVEQVSKFSNVLSMFGGSSSEAIGDLQKIQQAIVEFRTTGGGAFKNVSAQVGLSLKNMDGTMKNSVQIIEGLRERFKSLSKSAQLKVSQELGLSDPATLQMLRASDAEYKRIKENADKMNVVNKTTAKSVQEMTRILATLKMQWYGVGVQILQLVLPAVQYLTKAVKWFNDSSESTKNIILGITTALVAIKPASDIFNFMAGGVKALIAPLKLLFSLAAANPLIAIISAIALGVIYFDDITAAIDKFISKGTPFSDFCKKIVENLKLILVPFEMIGEAIGWASSKLVKMISPGKNLIDSNKPVNNNFVLPTSFQNEAVRDANNINTTNNNTSKVSNVKNQTFNFNGVGQDVVGQLQSVIRQNASGLGA